MIGEILSVGTELLMGQIANTDAQYLSRRMNELGVSVYRHETVGDNPARVQEALTQALARADLVITTGGLGPTEDDLTKEMVAAHFGLPLVLHQPSLDALVARMTALHPDKPLTPNNRKQALMPAGCVVMPNACGTAPGCIVEQGGKLVAVLPGPPRELTDMFEKQLAPFLAKRTGTVIHSRFLKIFGVGESRVEDILLDLFHLGTPTLALYCGAGEVQARMTAALPPDQDPAPLFDPLEREIRKRLGRAVYGVGPDASLAKTVLSQLMARGETLAVAESLTGGLIASRIVDCPGASNALLEGFVTYTDAAKMRSLGVSGDTLARDGAVSEACAREMADGARRATGADYALSATGLAGPDGGTDALPVGTVFLGLATGKATVVRRFRFLGDREWVRTLAAQNALNLLREAIPCEDSNI